MAYRSLVFLVITSILLAGCQQNGSTSSNLPAATQSVTLTSSFLTITPKPTLSPSVTPFPPLSGKPPFLLLQAYSDKQQLSIYDHNGKGRKDIVLPQGGWLRAYGKLNKIISPDGNWIAFYEGTAQGSGNLDNLPVSLNILNLKNGSTKKIVEVVTEGYLSKLEEVAEQLKMLEPDYYKPIDGDDWVANRVSTEFQWSIYSVAWSPDNKYLAFAGHIDGISSDVYIYDLETESTIRVEDTLQNVQWITWSPDGEYLIFTNSHPGYVYTGSILYSISVSDFKSQKPRQLISGTWLYVGDWLSPTTILAAQGTDTAGLFYMQVIDITTGRANLLWDDGFGDFVIDHKNQSIIFTASEYADPEKFGIYEVSFNGKLKKIFNGLYWVDIFLRNGIKHRYLIAGGDHDGEIRIKGEVVGVNEQNEPTYLGKFDHSHISISPDGIWLLMYDDEKIYLYDQYDELKNTFLIPNVYNILWTPDSSGLFYSTADGLFLLNISNGSTNFIDQCLEENCGFHLGDYYSMWLP